MTSGFFHMALRNVAESDGGMATTLYFYWLCGGLWICRHSVYKLPEGVFRVAGGGKLVCQDSKFKGRPFIFL